MENLGVTERDAPVASGRDHDAGRRIHGRSKRGRSYGRCGWLMNRLDHVRHDETIAVRRVEAFPVTESWIVLGYRPLKPVIETAVALVGFHHLGQERLQEEVEIGHRGFMRQAQARLGLQQQLVAQAEPDRRQHDDKCRHWLGYASGGNGHGMDAIQPVSRACASLKRSLRQLLGKNLMDDFIGNIEKIRRWRLNLLRPRLARDDGRRFPHGLLL